MKIIIIKDNLKNALNVVNEASGENLNLPILKNVLLETENGKIKVTATNLEIAISSFVSGKVIEDGKAAIPLSMFLNILNNLPSERLNIELKKNILEIKTDNYEATVQCLPVEEFPIIPKIKNKTGELEIKSEVLKEGLSCVLSAAQFSDLRPELNSVLFNFSVDDFKITATDSFRLAEKTIPSSQLKAVADQIFKILIPLKTAQKLIRILKEEDLLNISHDGSQVLFTTASFEFISRLIEGNFPEYEHLIPKKFDSEVLIEKEEMINALKLTGVFSEKTNEIKIKIPESKKNIEITSVSQGVGENAYILSAKIQGKLNEINFNWKYFIDGLKALKTKEVWMGINEVASKPTVIKSPSDASYFYILMPIIK